MKLLKNIFWEILIVLYLTIVLSFVENERLSVPCRGIAVEINKEPAHDFIDQEEVRKMIANKGVKTKGVLLEKINLLKLEKAINLNPSIERCDVYRELNGSLCVTVKQRNPIVRVMNLMNISYYIDEKGAMMPLSDRYAARVPIANGYILNPYISHYYRDVTKITPGDTINKNVLRDIYILTKFIDGNEFLKALIEQIYVTEDYTFVLVPKMGPSTIMLGTIEDYEEKCKKLWVMYKKALPYGAWDKYASIDLQFKNQVVCTKK
jgi:cell division protein FtsQ